MNQLSVSIDAINYKEIIYNPKAPYSAFTQEIQRIFDFTSEEKFHIFTDDLQLVGTNIDEMAIFSNKTIRIALLNQSLNSQTNIANKVLNYISKNDELSSSRAHQEDTSIQENQEQRLNEEELLDLVIDRVTLKLYKCSRVDCRKTFDCPIELFTHTKSHNILKSYICNECQKCFQQKYLLKVHKKTHIEQKQYVCSFTGCTKQYAHRQRLVIHERTHIGVKPFECPFKNCGKTFNEKGNLKTHVRSHTGLRPYACIEPTCKATFLTQGHLNDHKKRHEKEKKKALYKKQIDSLTQVDEQNFIEPNEKMMVMEEKQEITQQFELSPTTECQSQQQTLSNIQYNFSQPIPQQLPIQFNNALSAPPLSNIPPKVIYLTRFPQQPVPFQQYLIPIRINPQQNQIQIIQGVNQRIGNNIAVEQSIRPFERSQVQDYQNYPQLSSWVGLPQEQNNLWGKIVQKETGFHPSLEN